MGVLIVTALLFGVYMRAPEFSRNSPGKEKDLVFLGGEDPSATGLLGSKVCCDPRGRSFHVWFSVSRIPLNCNQTLMIPVRCSLGCGVRMRLASIKLTSSNCCAPDVEVM